MCHLKIVTGNSFGRAVDVIFSDPLLKKGHIRFTSLCLIKVNYTYTCFSIFPDLFI